VTGPPDAGPSAASSPLSRTVALREAAWVLGVFAAAGVAAGLLWAQVTDPVLVTKGPTGVGIDEVELGHQFGADGWFLVLGGTAGLALGAAVTVWGVVRDRQLVLWVLLVLAGAALATLLMRLTGGLAGPGDPVAALAGAPVGATAPARLRVHASIVDLTWMVAALVGALAVLLSPLRRGR
jgi:hypothetical protein